MLPQDGGQGISVLMHKLNSLFSTQPTGFSSCFFSWLLPGTLLKTLGTCTSVNCFLHPRPKGPSDMNFSVTSKCTGSYRNP